MCVKRGLSDFPQCAVSPVLLIRLFPELLAGVVLDAGHTEWEHGDFWAPVFQRWSICNVCFWKAIAVHSPGKAFCCYRRFLGRTAGIYRDLSGVKFP